MRDTTWDEREYERDNPEYWREELEDEMEYLDFKRDEFDFALPDSAITSEPLDQPGEADDEPVYRENRIS